MLILFLSLVLQPNTGAGEKLEEEFTVARLYISKMKSEVKTLAGRASTLESQYAEATKKLSDTENELSDLKLKLQQVRVRMVVYVCVCVWLLRLVKSFFVSLLCLGLVSYRNFRSLCVGKPNPTAKCTDPIYFCPRMKPTGNLCAICAFYCMVSTCANCAVSCLL